MKSPHYLLLVCGITLFFISISLLLVSVPNYVTWARISDAIVDKLSAASVTSEEKISQTAIYWNSTHSICGCTLLLYAVYAAGLCFILQVMSISTLRHTESLSQTNTLRQRLPSVLSRAALFASLYCIVLLILWLVLHGEARQVFHICMKNIKERSDDFTLVNIWLMRYMYVYRLTVVIGACFTLFVALGSAALVLSTIRIVRGKSTLMCDEKPSA